MSNGVPAKTHATETALVSHGRSRSQQGAPAGATQAPSHLMPIRRNHRENEHGGQVTSRWEAGDKQKECRKAELSHELQNGSSPPQREKRPATRSVRTELRRAHPSRRAERSTGNRRDKGAEGQEALAQAGASLLLLGGRDGSGTCLADSNRAAGQRLELSEAGHQRRRSGSARDQEVSRTRGSGPLGAPAGGVEMGMRSRGVGI